MLFCAALGWDQRTAWTAFVESSDAVPAELAGFVPSDATVYWEGGLELLWLRLKRPSYFSCAQAAGVMFFQGTAMAYAHRSESLGRCGRPAAEHEARTTRAELQRACAREPELDWIVLPRLVEDVPRREWVSPVKLPELRITDGRLHIREHDRFHAYPCDALR
jgi:hypothetical protein